MSEQTFMRPTVRTVTRNMLWNLGGQGALLPAALVAIPVLVDSLGVERFGMLTLAWAFLGYFSLFDLGLGRALTKLVAEQLGLGQHEELPNLIQTALVLMIGLGVTGGLVAGSLAPWVVRDVLNVPTILHDEALGMLYVLALSIPLVTASAGLRGVLEAHQRFDFVNAVRIPLGLFTFLAPLAVLHFSRSLVALAGALAMGRFFTCGIFLLMCFQVSPALNRGWRVQRGLIRPLMMFGGWMTVTNVIGPLMDYLDRFLIGALLSMEAVAYYATPYDIVTKLWVIPGALVGVLFPAFAASLAREQGPVHQLFSRGVICLFVGMYPLVLMIVSMAQEGLSFWLGPEFAHHSTRVLQWLVVGTFVNSLAHVPYALIQSAGRPDLTAKLHLIELPLYLICVLWLINRYGIEGAAMAWGARNLLDMVLLYTIAVHILPESLLHIRRLAVPFFLALAVLGVACTLETLSVKGMFVLISVVVFALATWFFLLTSDDREFLRHRLDAIIVK